MFVYAVLIFVVCLCSLWIFYLDVRGHNIKDNDKDTKNENNISGKVQISKSFIIYSIIMILVTVSVSIFVFNVYDDLNLWLKLKKLSLLAIIWPIAYIDFKTFRIPNSFIIYGLILRLLIFGFELLFDKGFYWMTIISELVAALVLFVGALLCSVCVKNSIGYGDMKLFVVMGLFLGLSSMWSAIFVSLILSFFLAVFLLLSKRKSRKDAIPFAPTIVLGTYLSIVLNGA